MSAAPTIIRKYTVKLRSGNFRIPVKITEKRGRLWFKFPFSRPLMAEVKAMQGAKWHGFEDPPKKQWSVADCHRNRFQLAYLAGKNPYAHYDTPLDISIQPNRSCLFVHQGELFRFGVQRRQCMFAAEMGTGKTLAAIEVMEHSDNEDWWWVGPRSALAAVKLEFRKWESYMRPYFLTYDRLRILVQKGGYMFRRISSMMNLANSRLLRRNVRRLRHFFVRLCGTRTPNVTLSSCQVALLQSLHSTGGTSVRLHVPASLGKVPPNLSRSVLHSLKTRKASLVGYTPNS